MLPRLYGRRGRLPLALRLHRRPRRRGDRPRRRLPLPLRRYRDHAAVDPEILLAARDYFEDSPNILSTCAFNVINSGMRAEPGAIFPRVVELYRPDALLTDIFFVTPFLWPLETQKFESKVVAWLLAVPISQAERDYANANRAEALEAEFERYQIDIFDLDRPSVV